MGGNEESRKTVANDEAIFIIKKRVAVRPDEKG